MSIVSVSKEDIVTARCGAWQGVKEVKNALEIGTFASHIFFVCCYNYVVT